MLAHELLRIDAQTAQHSTSSDTRDIPIFLFSLDQDIPVFVDVTHRSRALPGMVVAVQSSQRYWETPFACNQEAIYWDLRDPLRSVVGSAAHVLGGLLPMQTTWNEAHERTSEDWQWAVGESPLSPTSPYGLVFSGMQVDALHRNYGVTALVQASITFNQALARLSLQRTTESNRVLGEELVKVYLSYLSCQSEIQGFAEMISEGAFQAACSSIAGLQQKMNLFADQVDTVLLQAQALECTMNTNTSQSIPSFVYMICGSIAATAVLIRLLRKPTYKPKIN